ncbi:MAG: anaerobic ribonucleoside-triphosphate reductase [Christensenellales bacterium]
MLKHGTLSVGFIGLAETLKALTGEHHGESEQAQALGLEIIGHMRGRMDAESAEAGLNLPLLATPAEGLSGRFVKHGPGPLRRASPASPIATITPTPSTCRCTSPSPPIDKIRDRGALSRADQRRPHQLHRDGRRPAPRTWRPLRRSSAA